MVKTLQTKAKDLRALAQHVIRIPTSPELYPSKAVHAIMHVQRGTTYKVAIVHPRSKDATVTTIVDLITSPTSKFCADKIAAKFLDHAARQSDHLLIATSENKSGSRSINGIACLLEKPNMLYIDLICGAHGRKGAIHALFPVIETLGTKLGLDYLGLRSLIDVQPLYIAQGYVPVRFPLRFVKDTPLGKKGEWIHSEHGENATVESVFAIPRGSLIDRLGEDPLSPKTLDIKDEDRCNSQHRKVLVERNVKAGKFDILDYFGKKTATEWQLRRLYDLQNSYGGCFMVKRPSIQMTPFTPRQSTRKKRLSTARSPARKPRAIASRTRVSRQMLRGSQ